MNTKSLVKLIKKAKLEQPPTSDTQFINDEIITDENRWSRTVRTWVRDFQEDAQRETLPAFDRLFKDAS